MTEIVIETEIVIPDLLLQVPKRGGKAIESKQKSLDGPNTTVAKLPRLITMDLMMLNLMMVKENVVLPNHKLKVVEMMTVTEIVIEIATETVILDLPPRKGEKEIGSKPKCLDGQNTTVVKSHGSTAMEHMTSHLKMVKGSVVLLNHK